MDDAYGDYGLPRVKPKRAVFDLGDLRLLGMILMVVVLICGLAAVLGFALRIFLLTSGLR